jgi:CopG family transcriptional regulator, nickel-responsive regulator
MDDDRNNGKKKRSFALSAHGKMMRFGISADARLIEKFDGMIVEKSYANRSEAIRDLIRDQLVEFAWTKNSEDVIGTITLVYNHELKELTEKLTELEHQNHTNIISSVHVHLDDHSCLEVLIVRGKSPEIKDISYKLIGTRGVKHGKLTMTTSGSELY